MVPAVSSGFPPRIFLSASCCAHKYLLQLIMLAFASSWNASALSSTVRTAASSKGVPVERIFFFVGVGVKVVFCLPGSTTRTGMVAVCCRRSLGGSFLAAPGAALGRRCSFVDFRCASAAGDAAVRAFAAKTHLALRATLSGPLAFGARLGGPRVLLP